MHFIASIFHPTYALHVIPFMTYNLPLVSARAGLHISVVMTPWRRQLSAETCGS